MGASAANAASLRQYKHDLVIREGNWNKEQSVYRSKITDYKNESRENTTAAGRAYAAEQARVNEMFDKVAFQKQDMLTQLVQAQGKLGASEKTGKTAARMNTAMLGQFGRNNAIMAANLASARTAAMQRNEDTRLSLQSANNKAWSQVAMAPTPGIAPPPPVMQKPDYFGLATGLIGAVGGGLMQGGANKPPTAWQDQLKTPTNFNPIGDYTPPSWGDSFLYNSGINTFGNQT